MRGVRTGIVALALAFRAAEPVSAQVLATIAVDGSLADWSQVLTSPFQYAEDGPASGLRDLDAGVPSTGRDLVAFAWTHDSSALFFFVRRVASASNRQDFWFYIDVDEDDRLELGEPVIGVAWYGSNRRTDVSLYRYNPLAAGGDPLGDPATGLADGWDMPGTVGVVRSLYSATGGSTSGIEMEARVAWSEIGIAPGTPVRFHVASSNGTNLPGSLHDNMGGPAGRVGTTRIAGIRIAPAAIAVSAPAGGIAWLAHTVTNLGASPDRVELSWTASGGFMPVSVSYSLDLDGDGALDPTDPAIADTDGDGVADFGPLGPGASQPILAVAAVPESAADGSGVTITIRAASAGNPDVFATAGDTLTVAFPQVTAVKAVDRPNATPGDVLTYTVTYTSTGALPALHVVVADAVPPPTEYVAGSAAGAGATIEFSHDGGVSFDASETPPITHVRFRRIDPLPPGGSGTVSFRVRVP